MAEARRLRSLEQVAEAIASLPAATPAQANLDGCKKCGLPTRNIAGTGTRKFHDGIATCPSAAAHGGLRSAPELPTSWYARPIRHSERGRGPHPEALSRRRIRQRHRRRHYPARPQRYFCRAVIDFLQRVVPGAARRCKAPHQASPITSAPGDVTDVPEASDT